jgi:hypothetical protein
MKRLKIDSLVGKTVVSVLINKDNDLVVMDTDSGKLYLTWVGDCCAQCFLANVSGAEFLVGSTILSAEHSEWKTLETSDKYGVMESMGTKIKTSKGYVNFESRVSHNGYYGGWIQICDTSPLDQYGRNIDPKWYAELSPLKDF